MPGFTFRVGIFFAVVIVCSYQPVAAFNLAQSLELLQNALPAFSNADVPLLFLSTDNYTVCRTIPVRRVMYPSFSVMSSVASRIQGLNADVQFSATQHCFSMYSSSCRDLK